jgi:hypothetical protein
MTLLLVLDIKFHQNFISNRGEMWLTDIQADIFLLSFVHFMNLSQRPHENLALREIISFKTVTH